MKSLSIVIPVYNTEKYLEECFLSIIPQLKDDDEVIFIEDGSTDGSRECLVRLIHDCGKRNIRLIALEVNMGLSNARNIGIEAAKGEYIAFVDSDDYIEQGALSQIDNEIRLHNCDMVVTKINGFAEADVNRSYLAPELNIEFLNALPYAAFFEEIAKTGLGLGPSVRYICRKDIIDRFGLRFENIHDEDQIWSAKLVLYCKTVRLFYDDYYHYRLRGDSLSTSCSFERVQDLFAIGKSIYSLIEDYPEHKNFLLSRSRHMYNKAVSAINLLPQEQAARAEALIASDGLFYILTKS
ncbi:MAG: glycosyltransferase family 2 protein [Clostridiaceae bacterium]|jgi:glycosyltransferase EpsH|nr:glycosyltransferase family 2 protein [Clostridiaceae bacterium]